MIFNLKKVILFLVTTVILSFFAVAAPKFSVLCTTFPEYDWILNILGEKQSDFDVYLLQNNGTDLHSYQPSVKDAAKISVCDLFVFVGGESDFWAEKVLKNSKNKDMIVVNLVKSLGEKIKKVSADDFQFQKNNDFTTENLQNLHLHHRLHNHSNFNQNDYIEYDEHIWLSLKNAAFFVDLLCKNLEKIDYKNSNIYRKNSNDYINKISALDAQFEQTVKNAKRNTVLFADRFPFRYLFDDYGLVYFAAFAGCSAESEASFETVAFLANMINKFNLPVVLTLEKSDKKLAKTVISASKNTDLQILSMNSLQSITKNDSQNYLTAMQNNLEVLKKALN